MKKLYFIFFAFTLFHLSNAQVIINPGDDIQLAVNANPSGTTFIIKSGVHRLQDVNPKTGDSFIGEKGTIMNGSMVLTNWTFDGTYWSIGGQTQQGQQGGFCVTAYPGCIYAEDLFINDLPLTHVVNLSDVATGTWYFDYNNDKVYMKDDPTGKKVEIGTARRAFGGSADNVTIKNIVIEKYAIPAQMGAIGDQYPGKNWIIENNEVRWNHGTGLNADGTFVYKGNYVHHNGQKGIGGTGKGGLVDSNEVSYNNWAGYDAGWDGGGSKFANSQNLTVTNNFVHHNTGPGLWTDINNIYTLYEGNLVEDNTDAGIFHEISYDAIIRCNTVRRNGVGFDVWAWGSQIQIAASPNVKVFNNTVEVGNGKGNGIFLIQQIRGTGTYGKYVCVNDSVYQNEIYYMGTNGNSGSVGDLGENPKLGTDNYFNGNTFHITDVNNYQFSWAVVNLNRAINWTELQGYGQEANGSIDNNIYATPKKFPGCSKSVSTDIRKNNATSLLTVYPNPTDGRSTQLVMNSAISGNYTISIVDLAGRIVYQANASCTAGAEQTLNLSLEDCSKGMYLLNFEIDGTSNRLKLIKE